jgi:hypothetical protein
MSISTFKGVTPVEDWSQLGNKIDQSVNRYEGLERDRKAKDEQNRKEAEAKYLQQAKVDPIYTASSYWQKEQGKQISDFTKYLGQVYYRSKNQPSIQDQIDIQNHKQALLGWQQNLANDQKKYKTAVKEVEKDPYGKKYDVDHFKSRVNDWINPDGSGKLSDDLLLPPLIQDLKAHNIAKKYSGKMQKNETVSGKVKTTVESVPEDQKKAHVIEDLYKDPSEYRSATESFNALPKEEKQQWLAKYPEKKSDKAITDWYYDTYGKYAYPDIVNKELAPRGESSGSGQKLYSTVNQDNPSEPATITRRGKEQKIDTWGEVELPYAASIGDMDIDKYVSMKDGMEYSVKPGKIITPTKPYIKYMPYIHGSGFPEENDYRWDNGKVKGGMEIIPFLMTGKDNGKNEIGIPLTDRLRNKLKSRFGKMPGIGDEIDKLPSQIDPKLDEESGNLQTKKTVTKKDPLGLF